MQTKWNIHSKICIHNILNRRPSQEKKLKRDFKQHLLVSQYIQNIRWTYSSTKTEPHLLCIAYTKIQSGLDELHPAISLDSQNPIIYLRWGSPHFYNEPFTTHKTKQTPWSLVRERTIPTERPPYVNEN
jgi:hypothetical protein